MIDIARPVIGDEEKAIGSGLLWRIGIGVLLGIMVSYALLIIMPYYESDIHLMKAGEIYAANNSRNLAEGNFLWDNNGLLGEANSRDLAVASLVLYVYVGIPMFLALSAASLTRWNTLSAPNRAITVASTILFLTLLCICITSWKGVGAWLFD